MIELGVKQKEQPPQSHSPPPPSPPPPPPYLPNSLPAGSVLVQHLAARVRQVLVVVQKAPVHLPQLRRGPHLGRKGGQAQVPHHLCDAALLGDVQQVAQVVVQAVVLQAAAGRGVVVVGARRAGGACATGSSAAGRCAQQAEQPAARADLQQAAERQVGDVGAGEDDSGALLEAAVERQLQRGAARVVPQRRVCAGVDEGLRGLGWGGERREERSGGWGDMSGEKW